MKHQTDVTLSPFFYSIELITKKQKQKQNKYNNYLLMFGSGHKIILIDKTKLNNYFFKVSTSSVLKNSISTCLIFQTISTAHLQQLWLMTMCYSWPLSWHTLKQLSLKWSMLRCLLYFLFYSFLVSQEMSSQTNPTWSIHVWSSSTRWGSKTLTVIDQRKQKKQIKQF